MADVVIGQPDTGGLALVTAHPSDAFDDAAAEKLAQAAGRRLICVNPRAATLDALVDDIEAARRALGVARWIVWGMSGGGWLAQRYAARFPEPTAGLVLESTCACFRRRLADPACVISPFFPAWRPALEAAGLIDPSSHDGGDAQDSEWIDVPGVGAVLRRRGGPALLVSPVPLSPAMTRVLPALWDFDARPWLGGITAPTLVVASDADPVVPLAHQRALHEAIGGSSMEVVAGGGHVPSVDARSEIREAAAAALRAFVAGV